jgi:Zn-dependent peptidase ImmA (M78 family)
MSLISQIAYDLLQGNKSLPIPIETIVANHGIKLLSYDLGEGISGVLIIEQGEATIGYNKNEHRVRNRFTIAHEFGHYMLHKEKDLFVDKDFKVMFRANPSNDINEKHEKEANEFAASILMPEDLLRREIDLLDLDYTDENAVKILAKKFDVSPISMSIRISKINFF